MKIWEPKSCCCGASIKVVALVLGWLRLIGAIFSLLSYLKFVAVDYNGFAQICKEASDELNQPIDVDGCATITISVIAVCGVYSGLLIIMVSLFLAGVNKNKPKMMLPYLVTSFMELVFFSLVIFIAFVVFLLYVNAGIAFIILTILGLVLALEVYFFLVIHACYKEEKRHSERMGSECEIPYTQEKDILYKI
ncbi:uncharacterized protein [Palaemon carinicauda]|uniref:uncharacterized protein isoform X1 n=1 Tax=Palaemon carinicauda TaxID=392227 RepID=UPI0035B63FA0